MPGQGCKYLSTSVLRTTVGNQYGNTRPIIPS
jgi:hypothetical protein